MLSKRQRLYTPLFNIIIKNGAVLHSSLFTLRYLKSPTGDSRYAVVAPKSIAKTAVKRNSLRRKGYLALSSLQTPKNVSFIALFKAPAILASKGELSAEFASLLNKIVVK